MNIVLSVCSWGNASLLCDEGEEISPFTTTPCPEPRLQKSLTWSSQMMSRPLSPPVLLEPPLWRTSGCTLWFCACNLLADADTWLLRLHLKDQWGWDRRAAEAGMTQICWWDLKSSREIKRNSREEIKEIHRHTCSGTVIRLQLPCWPLEVSAVDVVNKGSLCFLSLWWIRNYLAVTHL